MNAWERSYQPRKWKVYEVTISEYHKISMAAASSEFRECNSDSQRAAEWGESPDRFYTDYELAAAGLDPTYGTVALARLTSEWHGYCVGTLLLVSCEGINKTPPTFSVCVEVKE